MNKTFLAPRNIGEAASENFMLLPSLHRAKIIVLCASPLKPKDTMRPMPCDISLTQPSIKLNSSLRQASSSNFSCGQGTCGHHGKPKPGKTEGGKRTFTFVSGRESSGRRSIVRHNLQPTNPTYRYKSLGKNEVRKQ